MLDRPDMAAWGTMISAFVHQGWDCEAIRSLNLLIEAGEKPDEFILGSILSSCASTVAYCQTKSVHSLIIKLGFEGHVFVASAVLDAYAKCGDIQSAKMAFNQSCKSSDVVIYNAMIIAYAHHGRVVEALDTYDKMKLANLQPSQATFVSVIAACGHIGHVEKGCRLFKSMDLYGMEPSPDIYGCLVDMFSRNGYLEDAKQIIESLPYPAWPAILRSLLSGCRMYGNRELGEWAAKKLLQLVPHNDAAHALLFKVYSELGNWEDAARMRREMAERGLRKDPGHSWIEAW
jgi:pentatricopeptide repeat protein